MDDINDGEYNNIYVVSLALCDDASVNMARIARCKVGDIGGDFANGSRLHDMSCHCRYHAGIGDCIRYCIFKKIDNK